MAHGKRTAGAVTGATAGAAAGPIGAVIGGAAGYGLASLPDLLGKKKKPKPKPWYVAHATALVAGVGLLGVAGVVGLVLVLRK